MAEQEYIRKTDRRYLKYKMKRIKKAKQQGNEALAQRHAIELAQYFGIGGQERPIEMMLGT